MFKFKLSQILTLLAVFLLALLVQGCQTSKTGCKTFTGYTKKSEYKPRFKPTFLKDIR